MSLSIRNIGLFGDSFAGYSKEDFSHKPVIPGHKSHWSVLLAEELNASFVNYGEPGSSVYFSYKQFVENYRKHDFNIFLVTEPGRYIKKVELSTGKKIFVPSLASIHHAGTDLHDPPDPYLRGWFLASDDEFNLDMSDLMLSRILEIAPKTLIIPCFPSSLSEKKQKEIFDGTDMNLCAIQSRQAKAYNIPMNILLRDYQENDRIMAGHFVPEFNELIYKIIAKRIKTGVWDWTLPAHIDLKYKLEEAWNKRQQHK